MSAAGGGRSPLVRLSVMMALQYAVWGAWLPLAARYMSAPVAEGGLGFSGSQLGLVLGLAGSVGAVLAPFVAGQLADRRFRTERFLAFLLVAGGVIQWMLAERTSFRSWLWLSLLYSACYMPTLALSNSLAFAHLSDRDREFPRVRLWGTIGWILPGWLFPMVWLQEDLRLRSLPPFLVGDEVAGVTARLADSLQLAAAISFAYALFCFLLPATPPRRDAAEPLAFAKAFRLLRRRSFAVLVLASLPISVIHQVYFIQTGPFFSAIGLRDSSIGPAMTIGQMSEIAVMLALGWMLKRLGFRVVLALGALAYFARYWIWSHTDLPVEVLVASQVLHGVCYACFFASAFVYVDRIAPPDVRHSAQTVFGILVLGGGPVLGGKLSAFLQERWTQAGTVRYGPLWMALALIGLAAALFVLGAFRDETYEAREPSADPVPAP